MKRVRFNKEQNIAVLREREASAKTADLARITVSEATLYNWKAKYGGGARRLRALEDANRS